MDDLVVNFGLHPSALGHLTSAVQFGFICGTLVFALTTLSDRFSPSKVFLLSAVVAAAFNAGMIGENHRLPGLLTLRFATGFFLAGIYPVGMKIAADYYREGLGKSLGYLVGALVLGTALPHLLKGLAYDLPWKFVIISTSGLAITGGLLVGLGVPDGPYRSPSQKINFSAFLEVFKNPPFRSAAFGYFGHMWELYAFWAFVPIILSTYNTIYPESGLNISLLSFLVIGVGGFACVLGGNISMKLGAKRTATSALFLSCLCCLMSPLVFFIPSHAIFIAFLLFWGMVVIADSPLFSTLVANNAEARSKGTALTIVNCVGFSITIFSIQLLTYLLEIMDPRYIYLVLAFGPILGLLALRAKRND